MCQQRSPLPRAYRGLGLRALWSGLRTGLALGLRYCTLTGFLFLFFSFKLGMNAHWSVIRQGWSGQPSLCGSFVQCAITCKRSGKGVPERLHSSSGFCPAPHSQPSSLLLASGRLNKCNSLPPIQKRKTYFQDPPIPMVCLMQKISVVLLHCKHIGMNIFRVLTVGKDTEGRGDPSLIGSRNTLGNAASSLPREILEKS